MLLTNKKKMPRQIRTTLNSADNRYIANNLPREIKNNGEKLQTG